MVASRACCPLRGEIVDDGYSTRLVTTRLVRTRVYLGFFQKIGDESKLFVFVVEDRIVPASGSKTSMWFGLGRMLMVCLLEDNARCTASVAKPNMYALAVQMSVRHGHECSPP